MVKFEDILMNFCDCKKPLFDNHSGRLTFSLSVLKFLVVHLILIFHTLLVLLLYEYLFYLTVVHLFFPCILQFDKLYNYILYL